MELTSMHKGYNVHKFGFYTTIITSFIALITFVIAIFTPPLSGPFCKVSCFEYPFTNIAGRFPRDYFWMYPAIILIICFVVFMVMIQNLASKKMKLFSQIGLSFTMMSASILILDYFVQLAVIQPSILSGENQGIALLSQYNPHGIFIAMEEIGYIFMSLAFLFMVPVFSKFKKLNNAVRWTFIFNFAFTIISLIIISLLFGIHREYRFEVAAITINWLTLIIAGILMSLIFRKRLSKDQSD